MTAVFFVGGMLVWLLALYAFVRIAFCWYRVYRAAPAGQGVAAAFDLGVFNFPAVTGRLGDKATPIIASFRRHAGIFAACVAALVVLIVLSIATGQAA